VHSYPDNNNKNSILWDKSRGNAMFASNATALNLSDRETEILHFIAKGMSNKEIAILLELSVHTIMTHTKNIYRKLNVNSRSEAVYELMFQQQLE